MELPLHSSNTSPFTAEASFKANVEKILDFLIIDTTYATDVTEKELDLTKAHVDTVNSFIVVAAFIAAVQGQMTALTFGVNDTSLQTFTNGIGLIGLTFDILGTSFGLLLALALQGYIQRSKAWLHASTIERLTNEVRRRMGGTLATDADREEIAEALDEYMRERRIFWRKRLRSNILPGDKSFKHHRDLLLGETMKVKRLGTSAVLSLIPGPQRLIALTKIPVITMGLGIVCLFVSVICFAANTQHRHVWLACVIVAMTTIACSSICLVFLKLPEILEAYAFGRTSTSLAQDDRKFSKLITLTEHLTSLSKT